MHSVNGNTYAPMILLLLSNVNHLFLNQIQNDEKEKVKHQ